MAKHTCGVNTVKIFKVCLAILQQYALYFPKNETIRRSFFPPFDNSIKSYIKTLIHVPKLTGLLLKTVSDHFRTFCIKGSIGLESTIYSYFISLS